MQVARFNRLLTVLPPSGGTTRNTFTRGTTASVDGTVQCTTYKYLTALLNCCQLNTCKVFVRVSTTKSFHVKFKYIFSSIVYNHEVLIIFINLL